MAEVAGEYMWPRSGEKVSYRARAVVEGGTVLFGPVHYRFCPGAEDDCRDLLRQGFREVYLDQLEGFEMVASKPFTSVVPNNDMSGWKARGQGYYNS